jgi:hypothetical protein
MEANMDVRRLARRIAVCSCVVLAVAPHAVRAQGAALSPELQSVRKLLDKYADPIAAVHDGFYSSVACITYPNGGGEGSMRYAAGAMGVHFINMGNVGPKLDPAKPQVLIYEPAGDKLRLVAAEWFMPVEVAGGKAPSIFGQELGGPMEGHKPVMPEGLHHYDLHVWLWKTNPEGAPKMAHPHK